MTATVVQVRGDLPGRRLAPAYPTDETDRPRVSGNWNGTRNG